MNKIDLIIENIEYAKILKESAHQNELLEEALAAARELKSLKPVAWMQDSIELYVKDHPTPTYIIPLYALDEVTK